MKWIAFGAVCSKKTDGVVILSVRCLFRELPWGSHIQTAQEDPDRAVTLCVSTVRAGNTLV